MVTVNENFLNIPPTYLFSEIAKRVAGHLSYHPEANIIKMGIGDVSLPLSKIVVEAIKKAADEQLNYQTFKGYGPEQGYDFLRQAIIKNDYSTRGIELCIDEIFISDGAKSDTGNIVDIFGPDNRVAVTDPSYPVYVDTNAMSGRAGKPQNNGQWDKLVYLPCTETNNFIPQLPEKPVDMIYLCYPNNPTGTTLTKEQLKIWVEYAKANRSIILFDAAYEAFITEDNVPHSIYEIEGAKEVAIEFRSFSKTAGFTGTRCGYTIIPKTVMAYKKSGEAITLNLLWNRRQCTKFNGVPYIIQRAAEATLTPEGQKEVKQMIHYYMINAQMIRETLLSKGYKVYGGINAPYIWVKTPSGMNSWEYFDYLLKEKNIVVTPGIGFGTCGEGFVRFSAFGTHEKTKEAIKRLEQ